MRPDGTAAPARTGDPQIHNQKTLVDMDGPGPTDAFQINLLPPILSVGWGCKWTWNDPRLLPQCFQNEVRPCVST